MPSLLKLAAKKCPEHPAMAVKRNGDWVKWSYSQYLSGMVTNAMHLVDVILVRYYGFARCAKKSTTICPLWRTVIPVNATWGHFSHFLAESLTGQNNFRKINSLNVIKKRVGYIE